MTKDTSPQAVSRFMLALSDSRTTAGDNRSSHIMVLPTTASIVRNQGSLISTMGWFFGKLNILTGLACLGVATVILAIFGRGGDRRNPAASLGLISLILGAFTLLFVKRSKEKAPRIASNPD